MITLIEDSQGYEARTGDVHLWQLADINPAPENACFRGKADIAGASAAWYLVVFFLIFPEPISIMPSASTGTHAGGYPTAEGAWGKSIPGRGVRCDAAFGGRARRCSAKRREQLLSIIIIRDNMRAVGAHAAPFVEAR